MSMVTTREPSYYISKDNTEVRLKKARDALGNGSADYKVATSTYKNQLMKNRGISSNKSKLELDCDKFGKYVFYVRIRAKLIQNQVYFYNIVEGTYDQVDERFTLKCLKEILEECPLKVWSMGRQKTYLESFMLCLEHIKELAPDPNSLLMKNGILHINEYCIGHQKLLPFTPDEIHLTRIPHNFDPTAKGKVFEQTLNDIFNNDKQLVQSLQEVMGWLLYYGGQWKIQKVVVFYGKGANGKSLLCSVIRRLLGESNCSSSFLDSVQERFGFQDMYMKMVNISPEAEQKKDLNSASFKALCGGDAVTFEFKHKTAFTAYNYTKLVICTNSRIKTNDKSKGFFRRLHIFPFENTYRELKAGEEKNPNLKYIDTDLEAKLMDEIPGILNFALEGLKRLIENNWHLTESDKMKAIQDQYYYEANELEVFTDQCLLFKEGSKIKSSEVYTIYEQWCRNTLMKDSSYGRNEFHRVLKEYLNSEGVIWSTSEIHGYLYYKGLAKAVQ